MLEPLEIPKRLQLLLVRKNILFFAYTGNKMSNSFTVPMNLDFSSHGLNLTYFASIFQDPRTKGGGSVGRHVSNLWPTYRLITLTFTLYTGQAHKGRNQKTQRMSTYVWKAGGIWRICIKKVGNCVFVRMESWRDMEDLYKEGR